MFLKRGDRSDTASLSLLLSFFFFYLQPCFLNRTLLKPLAHFVRVSLIKSRDDNPQINLQATLRRRMSLGEADSILSCFPTNSCCCLMWGAGLLCALTCQFGFHGGRYSVEVLFFVLMPCGRCVLALSYSVIAVAWPAWSVETPELECFSTYYHF